MASKNEYEEYTTAIDSAVGAGDITGWSKAGFPEVNGNVAAWCEFEDGKIFDPLNARDKQLNARIKYKKRETK